MRHFFVINPHSFVTLGSLKRILMDLENCFSIGRRMEYKIYISRRPRDAIAAVNRYVLTVPPDETVRVYAVGGDGILFDCLNGMVNFPNAELTSVPYGNANDFVRAFGEDAAPLFRDIKKLSTAPSRPVDIIHYGTNYALNEANIGLIGMSIIRSNAILRSMKSNYIRSITPHVYTATGFLAMMNTDIIYQEYEVIMDGEDISGVYGNIHIANGPCNGGNMVPNPYAAPDDGWLNAILGTPKNRLECITAITAFGKGHFEKRPHLEHRKFRKLEIRSQEPLCVELDGESFFAKEIKLQLIPSGIRFFAPEGLDFADFSHRAYKKRKAGGKQ